MASESRLQARCVGWARRARPDLVVVDNHGGGWCNKGFPDLTLYGRGRVVQVELKDGASYAVQPDQELWRRRFERAGIPARVARSFEEFGRCGS